MAIAIGLEHIQKKVHGFGQILQNLTSQTFTLQRQEAACIKTPVTTHKGGALHPVQHPTLAFNVFVNYI